jgi:hypothetical protein
VPAKTYSHGDLTAVINLAPGEPPEYGVESGSRRLALADDAQDVPPALLRPFYLRDLRNKYNVVGASPYREYHLELARKVQSRLDTSHRVYASFYSDRPSLMEAVAQAIDEGAGQIVIVHVRVSDPPDQVKAGDLMGGLKPANYGVKLHEVGPLWDGELLPQIYVRRVLEALPQVAAHPEEVGLLLIGRGHMADGGKEQSSTVRYNQEYTFQRKLLQELIKVGFDESRVAMGWLRWNSPGVSEALDSLARAGC